MTLATVFIAIATGLLSALLCWGLIKAGLRDEPNEAHKQPGKTAASAGGIALLTSVGFGLVLAAVFWPEMLGLSDALAWSFLAASLAGVTGLYDDLLKPRALSRLAVHVALAIGLASLFPVMRLDAGVGAVVFPYGIAVLGTALWIVVMTNAANFIDGADGMLGLCVAPGLAGLAIAGLVLGELDAALWAICLLASVVGFLLWNLGAGRLIAGDCGAIFIGFSIAAIGVDLASASPVGPWLAPLFFLPVLADVLLTLLYRAARRENLAQGHRQHLYQIAIEARMEHHQIALVYALLSLPGVILGLSALALGPGFAAFCLVILVLGFAWMSAKARRSARIAGRLA